jgi:hypothetical protein
MNWRRNPIILTVGERLIAISAHPRQISPDLYGMATEILCRPRRADVEGSQNTIVTAQATPSDQNSSDPLPGDPRP